ncbi:hypothetical protein FD754_014730 [Muntiacus muntjak]|uniref:G-protein coupled receptors family 1 profile domain-containing protein n=1 Tax=Muntiacus muntjak TaxID=9888 RepID=A0A5N3VLB9_MUNMU|nr:hypothetical protein FD754_014730 [Muntiacus muntjak]
MENNTEVPEFILLGLTSAPELQVALFIIFVLIYLVSVVGNLGLILLIPLDHRLRTTIYFFLTNLSLVDFCYSTAVTPKVMAGLLAGDQVISYNACAAQMLFFAALATVESYLLTSMAYDRFAAACNPLRYKTTMTASVCTCLATGPCFCGFRDACTHTGNTFRLSLCGPSVVHHFFCNVPAVTALFCSDKLISELILHMVASFSITFALLVILISYLFIFTTILKMRSAEGYQKALSICASHLTAVSIFYGTGIFTYSQPGSRHSMDTDKIASVFYTMVIPMLNPLVYSLRNKEVKNVFKKLVKKAKFSKLHLLKL